MLEKSSVVVVGLMGHAVIALGVPALAVDTAIRHGGVSQQGRCCQMRKNGRSTEHCKGLEDVILRRYHVHSCVIACMI